tara:strand:+ start:304 stop:531 length:228 start_codon:yes stop_codon:yes gene_type:complete
MTTIEKVAGVMLISCFVAVFYGFYYVFHSIDEAGGFKAVIINVGKELKDINKQINSDASLDEAQTSDLNLQVSPD